MFYQQGCNGDLYLGSFLQSKLIWAGLQRKGVSPLIEDPKDYIDHILKATWAIFPFSAEIPLPQEIQESLDFIMYSGPVEIVKFWDNRLERLRILVREAQTLQDEWNAMIPNEIKGGAETV